LGYVTAWVKILMQPGSFHNGWLHGSGFAALLVLDCAQVENYCESCREYAINEGGFCSLNPVKLMLL
jgi:hypothetical protein